MTLGERCDEIVRLIDETLCDLVDAPADGEIVAPGSEPFTLASVELELSDNELEQVVSQYRLAHLEPPARRLAVAG
ncbi:MAG TPA: hypothetical protein VMR97_01190 [Acidimicrobiales bacterium]|nr:hypothetical protein [Acidimicrobiales bacterium]